MLKKSRLATPMVAAVAAVAAALVSGSSEMVQPESAPARILVARITLMLRCHWVRCAIMLSLVAVEMAALWQALGWVYSGFVQNWVGEC